jgi:hypothetical protein
MVPVVQDQMEGCPEDENLNLLYLVLSSSILVTVFGMALTAGALGKIGNYFENWIGQCGFRQCPGQKPGFRCRRLPRPLGIWLWRQECELLAWPAPLQIHMNLQSKLVWKPVLKIDEV